MTNKRFKITIGIIIGIIIISLVYSGKDYYLDSDTGLYMETLYGTLELTRYEYDQLKSMSDKTKK